MEKRTIYNLPDEAKDNEKKYREYKSKTVNGYIGTYASTCENGIYRFTFDAVSKKFTDCTLYKSDKNTKYLSIYKGILAYPLVSGEGAVKMIRDGIGYTVGKESHVSCYITQDAEYIYTANYHDGTIFRYRKAECGLTDCTSILIRERAGAHQVILQKEVIIVPCLLLDCLNIYDRITMEWVISITFPPNSGPRHGVLSKDENKLYLVSESTCEVFCVNLKDKYRIEKILPLLDPNEEGAAAAIRKSADDRFLYVSVRKCNEIFVIDIKKWKIQQRIGSDGDHPRDIALDPTQQFLFVANRFSNNLIVFERDTQNGCLRQITQQDGVVEGVSIVFEGGNE